MKVKIGGNAKEVLKKIVAKTNDLSTLWADVSTILISSTKERFDTTKTSPDGKKWQPLSPEYAAFKKSVKPGVGILRFDDHLIDLKDDISPNELIVGSEMKYARRMQLGGGGVAARPYLGISDEDREEIYQSLLTHYRDL